MRGFPKFAPFLGPKIKMANQEGLNRKILQAIEGESADLEAGYLGYRKGEDFSGPLIGLGVLKPCGCGSTIRL